MMVLGTILVIIIGVVWTAIDAPDNLQIDHQRDQLG